MASTSEAVSPVLPADRIPLSFRSHQLEPAVISLGGLLLVFAVPTLYGWYHRTSLIALGWLLVLLAPFILFATVAAVAAAAPRAYIADAAGVRLLLRGKPIAVFPWKATWAIQHGQLPARQLGGPSKLRPFPYLVVAGPSDRFIVLGGWRFTIPRKSVREATDVTATFAAAYGIPVHEDDYEEPPGRRPSGAFGRRSEDRT